jgi:hypothetical protein
MVEYPLTTNNFVGNTFGIVIPRRMPNARFFSQRVVFPSVTIGVINVATPFHSINEPGGSSTFSPLKIEYVLDEYLLGWYEHYNWMREILPIRDQRHMVDWNKQASDIQLIMYSSMNNPLFTWTFRNAFPFDITAIELVTTKAIIEPITYTVSYSFETFDTDKEGTEEGPGGIDRVFPNLPITDVP